MIRIALLFVSLSLPVQAQDLPRIAGMAPEGSPVRPQYDAMLDNLDRLSGGRLEVEAFLSGELGPEETYFSAMRRGRIEMAAVSAYAVSQAVPEYALLRAPFLFDSFDQFAYIYDGYLKDAYAPLLADAGMVELRWIANGFENIYANRPLTQPQQVRGVRIRVPADPNAARVFQAVGADVIQVPFTDVIQSLQTGLIEGGESTSLYFLLGQFDAEAKHLTRTRHGFSSGVLVANKRWFDRQSPEDQAVYRDIYLPSREAFAEVSAIADGFLARAIENGLEVHDLSPSERASWAAATADVTAALAQEIGGEAERILALITEGKEAFAARQ